MRFRIQVLSLVSILSLSGLALADTQNPSLTFLASNTSKSEISILPAQSLPAFVKMVQTGSSTKISGHLPSFVSPQNLSGTSMNFNVFSDQTPVCSFTARIDDHLKVSVTDLKGKNCQFSGPKQNLDPFTQGAVFHLKLHGNAANIESI